MNYRNYRILVVDDEKLARDSIISLLEPLDQWEVIGECKNGHEAIETIKSHKPDLLLLDIEMPEMNGIEMLKSLNNNEIPYTIFITAYDKFALKAFEINAIDYLLKPYSDKRFYQSLKRAEMRLRTDHREDIQKHLVNLLDYYQQKIERNKSGSTLQNRFAAKHGNKIILIDSDEIKWIGASGSYIELHTEKGKFLLNDTITNMVNKLDPDKFVRIHRSTITSINHIKELEKYYNGEYIVILKNNEQLKLSRGYKDNLSKILGKI